MVCRQLGQFWIPGSKDLISGSKYLVPGSKDLVPESKDLDPGSKDVVQGAGQPPYRDTLTAISSY